MASGNSDPRSESHSEPLPPTTLSMASIDNQSLTYGVELEFVFAFNEITLRSLPGLTNCTIHKDLSYFTREGPKFTEISSVEHPGRVYNSWGIRREGSSTVKHYEQEPVDILAAAFKEQSPGFELDSFGIMDIGEKTSDKYARWLICKDLSVCGVGSRNIFPSKLDYQQICDHPEDWDSIGLEAVSRVFTSGPSDTGPAEIRKVIEILKGKEDYLYGSFITNQCALHVHVQAPEELHVLVELAIILLVYEEEICRLHPPCRRPHQKEGLDGPRGNIDSNRIFWSLMSHGGGVEYASVSRMSRIYQDLERGIKVLKEAHHSIDSLRDWLLRQAFQAGADMIASIVNAPHGQRPHHFGNRYRLVNFTTAANRGEGFPKTIEFRQARGSLDGDDVMHWVSFCLGLVRLATYYADNPGTFRVTKWPDANSPRNSIDIFDLLTDMGVQEDEMTYWETKIAFYQTGQPGDENQRTDNEEPPQESSYSGSEDESQN